VNTVDNNQLSPEWFAERVGLVTASRLNDVMSTLKSGGEAATRKNYRAQLVAERLTGAKAESFTNSAMQWGTETEPLARASYAVLHDVDVTQVGFIKHPTIELTGASPDGLIGDDGLIEIKCPNTATHIDYLLAGVVPSDYKNQMLWQMECTGRKWCDFVSYDPRLPEELALFVIRYEKDDDKLNELRDGVVKFLAEVKDVTEKLNALRHKEK
jgi:putative phage-type endonuclease